ncbi:type IV pilus modification protein PilV [Acinetobacter sp. CIP 101934]|uniref:prepilin-type N-terminal cleavage/methylation domain-containing protein n=1 Tax=Acinetobacter sp. CIP 101934 TaxID=1144661 RepID=UPI0002D0840F|nr:prepilin-type N-terminal cleavage/methylation domain-containing protein [Acinetobacter sp. CIP 101934]ENW99195.1 type IV pilus modification protein PilV [Acinetobacter sp. CIP 101934]
MKTINHQAGVGLMEVLISMIILAIAILGYSALHIKATAATEESIKRSDALIILNGLAEKIRLNPNGDYKEAIPEDLPDCSNGCDADDQALYDLKQYSDAALTKGIAVGVIDCLNTSESQKRLCLIAAWNDTEAITDAKVSSEAETPENACLKTDGKYVDESNCLVLEAY